MDPTIACMRVCHSQLNWLSQFYWKRKGMTPRGRRDLFPRRKKNSKRPLKHLYHIHVYAYTLFPRLTMKSWWYSLARKSYYASLGGASWNRGPAEIVMGPYSSSCASSKKSHVFNCCVFGFSPTVFITKRWNEQDRLDTNMHLHRPKRYTFSSKNSLSLPSVFIEKFVIFHTYQTFNETRCSSPTIDIFG